MPNPIANRKLRIFLIPAVLILALALAAAACGNDDEAGGTATSTATPTPTPEPTSAETTFEIKMVPLISFDRDELTVPADTDVTIVANNTETAVPHNFSVWESREVAEGGGAAISLTTTCNGPCVEELTVNLSAGEYFFRCDVHPSQMVGTLTVR